MNMGEPWIIDNETLKINAVSYIYEEKYACGCSNFRRLKRDYPVSKTYCCCCGGHFKYHYEIMLGVKLELIEVVSSPLDSDGKEIRSGGNLGNTAPSLWDEVYASKEYIKMESLPQVLSKNLFGWTCEYDCETNTFVYLVCALTPVGTPVPDGFVYRDIPETFCAVGMYGESVDETVKRAAENSI